MPATGPMRAALSAAMDSMSKLPPSRSAWAFSSSIATHAPVMSVTTCGVVLKNERWRFSAAAMSSLLG